MEGQKKRDKRWSRLKQTYQLVLRRDETFEEVYTMQLTPLNVYILISTIFFLVAVAVVCLILFTPVKTYIPGYGEITNNKVYMDLLRKTNNLEEQVKSQEIYIEGMRRMVMSDPQLASEVGMDSAIMGEQRQIIDRIPEDEALRREVNLEDQLNFPSGNLSSGKNGINRRVELHMIPPVKGMVSLGFSSDDKHYGVDVLSAANTPVKTILDGYVLHNGWNVETGHTIFVQHPNEMVSVYKHNSSLLRETGDFVRAGEAIAIIGNTGIHTDGPHLHFELWISGKPADPMTYIDFVREESRIIQ